MNLIVLSLLILSAFAVVEVVEKSKGITEQSTWLERNAITLVLSAISFFFPMFFESLGLLEYYHPRQQLRIQLARIMMLNLLNLYSLIFALFDKIKEMSSESAELRHIIEPTAMNGFEVETATTMTMPTITPELAVTTFTTVAAIITSMMTKGHPNKSHVTESSMDTTTFFDGYTTVSPYEIEVDENRNIKNTTDDENNILTTFATEETTTTAEIQDVEYDPSVAHYYLLTDEELELEKNRTKRVAIYDLNDTYVELDGEYVNSTFEEYDIGNFTENPSNATDANVNQTNDLTTENTMETTIALTTTETTTTELSTMKREVITTTLPTTPIYLNMPTTTAIAFVKPYSNVTQETLESAQKKIRNLCWETMFGQELVKLTVMDLVNFITFVYFRIFNYL